MDYSARWYSPTVGRFLTEDTVLGDLGNTQSLNRYSYVMNNPINMVDPSGHVPIPSWVKKREDRSLEYVNGGTTYYEYWNYDSHWEDESPKTLVETVQYSKFYEQKYQQTTTESWKYNYSKYFLYDEDIQKLLDKETQIYRETRIEDSYYRITAEQIAQQNAGTIASYGILPYARVSYSTSTLNGKPFSYDMIYGGVIKAQQFNEMKALLAAHVGGGILTSKDYNELSIDAYKNKYLEKGKGITLSFGGDYIVLDSVDKWSGLQGFAAVPFDQYGKGKTVTNIVTAFRGTQKKNPNDLNTDYLMVVMEGRFDSPPNQFEQANEFIDSLHKKYPDATISLTGHSLGGAIAQYLTVTNDYVKNAVTFSAPGTMNMYSWDEMTKAQNEEYSSRIIDYYHDEIIATSANPSGTGKEDDWVGARFQADGEQVHDKNSYIFDRYGNILIR
jgi:hypothetical protein